MSDDIERMIAEVVEAEDLPQPPAIIVPTGPMQPIAPASAGSPELFTDDEMLGLCAEALTNMRNDRKQIDTLISNLVEMVFNEGDSTTSSKEALVSLVVSKTNMSDKMMGIAELMAKFKLKQMAAAPKTVSASQENHYHFGGTRRSFLEQIEKRMKKTKKEEKKS